MKAIYYIMANDQKLAEAYDAMSASLITKTFFETYFNEPNLTISIRRIYLPEQQPVNQEPEAEIKDK